MYDWLHHHETLVWICVAVFCLYVVWTSVTGEDDDDDWYE